MHCLLQRLSRCCAAGHWSSKSRSVVLRVWGAQEPAGQPGRTRVPLYSRCPLLQEAQVGPGIFVLSSCPGDSDGAGETCTLSSTGALSIMQVASRASLPAAPVTRPSGVPPQVNTGAEKGQRGPR